MDRNNSTIHRILEEAALIVRREKETTGDVEPSEGYKRRQRSVQDNISITISISEVEKACHEGQYVTCSDRDELNQYLDR